MKNRIKNLMFVAFLLFAYSNTKAQNVLTPQMLIEMNRVSAIGLSNDLKDVFIEYLKLI